jgi:hypothetical protein
MRVNVNLTDEQHALLLTLMEGKSKSAFIKQLLRQEAARQGRAWPDDENTWGGDRTNTPSNALQSDN